MKIASLCAMGLVMLSCAVAQADQVVAERADNTVGGGFGAGGGALLGGALGGPFGALAGGAIGWLTGSGAQQASGASQAAYVVRAADGSEQTVRSPNAHFQVGQQVEQDGVRLRAVN